MKICPHCHRKNMNSARFCRFCGVSIRNVTPIPKTPKTSVKASLIKCPNCGRLIKAGSKFCRFCGKGLTPQSQSADSGVDYHKLWITAIIFTVLAVLMGVMFS